MRRLLLFMRGETPAAIVVSLLHGACLSPQDRFPGNQRNRASRATGDSEVPGPEPVHVHGYTFFLFAALMLPLP
jgi:hypothetical protein